MLYLFVQLYGLGFGMLSYGIHKRVKNLHEILQTE
jgi:hypothetical protein